MKETLVEISAFPPPMGAWSLRIEFVAERWRQLGRRCVLLNVGASRTLNDPKFLNVRGPLNYCWHVFRAALAGSVLHTHTNAKGVRGNLLVLAAQLLSLPLGRRSVLTFHAGTRQEYFPKTGRWLLDTLLWLVFHTPRVVICNSPAVKDLIVRDYGVPAGRIHPIPAFCREYMLTEVGQRSESVSAFLAEHQPLLVSYLFFFHEEFTPDLLFQAVARLRHDYPGLGMVLMGSQQYLENYQGALDQSGAAEHILLTGNLPRGEFLGVLKAGTLYLRTPLGDGVCSSVLESLALGTPVVASDNGTRPPSCLLYEGGNLEDMLIQVRHVLQNREAVANDIIKPDETDTLKQEIDVLLSVSRTIGPTS
jgi:glycosyltransferase involved in cell wall biosynthesis